MVQDTELKQLAEKKASGLATQVYLVLAAHSRKKESCFPSIPSISKMLGNFYHVNSIHKALRWLASTGFIDRKEATSKTRFIMKIREGLSKRFTNNPNGESKRKQKRKDNHRLSNSYRKKRNSNQYQSPKITPAQSAMEKANQWLEKALEYVFGMTDSFPPAGNRTEVNKLIGSGHIAGFHKDEIQSKLGHLLL